jgi:hypothetical protein
VNRSITFEYVGIGLRVGRGDRDRHCFRYSLPVAEPIKLFLNVDGEKKKGKRVNYTETELETFNAEVVRMQNRWVCLGEYGGERGEPSP